MIRTCVDWRLAFTFLTFLTLSRMSKLDAMLYPPFQVEAKLDVYKGDIVELESEHIHMYQSDN